MQNRCKVCGKKLTYNEIGATRKFINRGSSEFYCYHCLAEKLDVDETLIRSKIEYFIDQGCTLFTSSDE